MAGGGGDAQGGEGGCTCILCIPPGYAPGMQYAVPCAGVGKEKAADYDQGSCLPSGAYLNLVHSLQQSNSTYNRKN
jgi:hypothetical protein